MKKKIRSERIYFGGGCFWCIEAVFCSLPGVIKVVSGYAGGEKRKPTYQEVSAGTTGHAEVVMVEFDLAKVALGKLLEVFFTVHDPTTINRQGADVGSQYRSIILWTNESQREQIKRYIKNLNKKGKFSRLIVTEVEKLDQFWPAENYHQNYYEYNKGAPYCQIVIEPKLSKIKDTVKKVRK